MSSLLLERECPIPPETAIPLAVRALQRCGYELGSSSDTEAHLLFTAGSSSAPRLDTHRHRLMVASNGTHLSFLFEAGVGSSGMVSEPESASLARRVDEVVAQVQSQARPKDQPRSPRCGVCATPVRPDEVSCPMCGIPLGR